MSPGEKRANAAGYLDAANTLVARVSEDLRIVSTAQNPRTPAAFQIPPALFEQLAEAQRILGQCADWMISPHNAELEAGK